MIIPEDLIWDGYEQYAGIVFITIILWFLLQVYDKIMRNTRGTDIVLIFDDISKSYLQGQ